MPDHKTALRLAGMEALENMLGANETVMIAAEKAALEQPKDQKTKQTTYFVVETSAKRRRGISIDLPDAILDATKFPPFKICLRPGCKSKGFPQPLAMFGPDDDARDGHQSVCRSCEAKRVNAINQRKKLAKVEAEKARGQEKGGSHGSPQ